MLLKCDTALRGGRGGTGVGVGWEFASGVSLGLRELVAFPVFHKQLTMGSVFFLKRKENCFKDPLRPARLEACFVPYVGLGLREDSALLWAVGSVSVCGAVLYTPRLQEVQFPEGRQQISVLLILI